VGAKTVAELQAVPAEALLDAARSVLPQGMGGMGGPNFGPIVDGVVLKGDPFANGAPAQSKAVPVMIGYNKDEMTLFTAPQPWFGRIDGAALDKMAPMFGPDAAKAVAYLRAKKPDENATYIANEALTWRFAQGSYIIADAIAKAGGAPVYMYKLTWETPIAGGIFRTPHTLDMPFMFANAATSAALVGTGDAPARMEAMMSDAWLAFARTGKPASALLPAWPAYTVRDRQVMELDLQPKVVRDPEKGLRELSAAK
jgi:para-nitrobenzyl esterase